MHLNSVSNDGFSVLGAPSDLPIIAYSETAGLEYPLGCLNDISARKGPVRGVV